MQVTFYLNSEYPFNKSQRRLEQIHLFIYLFSLHYLKQMMGKWILISEKGPLKTERLHFLSLIARSLSKTDPRSLHQKPKKTISSHRNKRITAGIWETHSFTKLKPGEETAFMSTETLDRKHSHCRVCVTGAPCRFWSPVSSNPNRSNVWIHQYFMAHVKEYT